MFCVSVIAATVVAADVKELVIPKVPQSPVIDGDLTDAVWSKAAEASGFFIAGTNKLAQQQTKVRALFTDKGLYFAFDCDDTEIASSARKHGENAWQDDCVEIFLSPQRKPDVTYHFLLNVDGIKTWRRAANDGYGPGDSWQAATHKRSGGWTAEIEIPFESFLELELYPRLGDLWGVKLTREDYAKPGAPPVELSSWTAIAKGFDDVSAFGDLVFTSRNLLVNGSAETDLDKDGLPDGWKFQYEKREEPAKGRLDGQTKCEGAYSLRVDYSNQHLRILPAGGYPPFRPGTTYKFSAWLRLSGESAWLLIGNNQMEIQPTEEFKLFEIYYKHSRSEGDPMIWPYTGKGTLWVDDVRLEVVREYEEPGTVCLTGNATGELKERNVETGGAYTYYEGYTLAQYFPYYPSDRTEPGRSSGWVPFKAGRLTDGNMQNKVSWPVFWMSRNGVTVEFDLKRNYLIKKIEVYSDDSSIKNCITSLKPADGVTYVRTFARYHPNASTMQRQGYVVIRDIDAGARWVRLNLYMPCGGDVNPGINEVRIWGKKIDGTAPAPKPGILPNERKTEPVELSIGKAFPCPIFPLPQEFQEKSGNFSINSQTKIVVISTDDKRALTTAEVLRDEIRNDTGLEVSISLLSELAEGAATNIIVLGEPGKVPLLSTELKKANLAMPQATPGDQGYVLDISPPRILIAGCSPLGTFYGGMSLLQLLKQDVGGWSVPCAAIRDWPDQQYRFVRFYALPQPRDLAERFIRTLARFKINYPRFLGDEKPRIEIMPLAEKYFVKVTPGCLYNSASEFFGRIKELGLIEHNPEESMEDLNKVGTAAQNPCPSNPKTWEVYEDVVSKIAPKYNSDFVDIGWDVCALPREGSRWNVCPLCRQRNMHGHELMAYTINNIQSILDKYGKRAIFYDGPVSGQGISYPDDKENDWRKAQDLISRKVGFYDYLKKAGAQLARKGFMVLNWSEDMAADKIKTIEGQQGFYLDTVLGSPFKPHDLLGMSQITWSPRKIEFGSVEYDRLIEQQLFRYNELTQGVELPLRRSGNKNQFMVDIKTAANCSLTDEIPYDGKGWIDEGPTRDLRALKTGRRVFAGVPFYIISPEENENKQCVMVHNRGYFNRSLPEQVSIPFGKKAASLIFLHALDRTAGHTFTYRRELAGFYLMVYEDGAYDKHEIRYNKNIANWDKFPESDYAPKSNIISDGFLAWKGTTLGGEDASLYASEWVNPYPDRPIERIIFMATARQQPFNPILLSVTGIEPTQRDLDLWTNKKKLLGRLADIMPQRPTGKIIDLSGGTNESEKLYIAPDGTRIEFDNVYNSNNDFHGAEIYRDYAGNIATDNNWGVANCWDVQTISIILPEPRILSCIGVFGRPTLEDNYLRPVLGTIDYQIDISPDGEDFHALNSITKYTPEKQGWQYHSLKPQPVKEIRIKVSKVSGQRGNGIAGVRLYEPNLTKNSFAGRK